MSLELKPATSKKLYVLHTFTIVLLVAVTFLAFIGWKQFENLAGSIQEDNKTVINALTNIDKSNERIMQEMSSIIQSEVKDWLDTNLLQRDLLATERANRSFEIANLHLEQGDALIWKQFENLAGSIQEDNKTVINALTNIDKSNERIMQEMSSIIQSEVKDWLDTNLLQRDLLATERANRSFEIANLHLEQGDALMGRVYLLNSVNHDPLNIQHIQALASLSTIDPTDYELRSEIRSVLEVAIFKVAPDDVAAIVSELKKLDELDEAVAAAPTPVVNWEEEFELAKATLGLNIQKTAQRTEKLENSILLLEEIALSVEESDVQVGLLEEVQQELEFAQEAFGISSIVDRVNHILSLIEQSEWEEDDELSTELTQGRYIIASTVFSNMWEFNVDDPRCKTIRSEIVLLQDQLEVVETKLNMKKSESAHAEILNALKYSDTALIQGTLGVEPNEFGDGPMETRLLLLRDKLESVSTRIQEITYQPYVNDVNSAIKRISNEMQLQRREQYKAYQFWATNLISSAHTRYNDIREIWDTETFTNNDAEDFMDNYLIDRFDQRLLSPDVAEVYQFIKGLILGEVGPDKKLEFKIRFMKLDNKIKLEHF